MSTLINLLLGVMTGLFVALFVEWLKKPTISFHIVDPLDQTVYRGLKGEAPDLMSSTHRVRFLRVEVLNRDLPPFLTWLLDRNVAQSCIADLHFRRMDGVEDQGHDSRVRARWTATPQPSDLFDKNNRLPASARETLRHRTIYLERPESIDICMKIFGEEDCYIFNNENYLHPDLKRSEGLLAREEYVVEVEVFCGTQRFSHSFKLNNTLDAYELRLEHLK